LLAAIAMPVLPTHAVGKPLVSWFQVVPPSVDLNTPLPGPPLYLPQVKMVISQVPAKRTSGLVGSMSISETPVFSLTNSTRSQVLPPSLVR